MDFILVLLAGFLGGVLLGHWAATPETIKIVRAGQHDIRECTITYTHEA